MMANQAPINPDSRPPVKYNTNPIPAMKTVDKVDINPATMMAMMPHVGVQSIAGVIEVKYQELHGERGDEVKLNRTGTKVAFSKIFNVSGHNYLFTSACCMECIEAKHKKMLRAYLIDHGMKPRSIKLLWKVWRATR